MKMFHTLNIDGVTFRIQPNDSCIPMTQLDYLMMKRLIPRLLRQRKFVLAACLQLGMRAWLRSHN